MSGDETDLARCSTADQSNVPHYRASLGQNGMVIFMLRPCYRVDSPN